MEDVVLVTFATRYGSTADTAQAIAGILRDRGLAVEVQPVRCVASVERYSAVVLGAALYIGRLHKDARYFLSANRNFLARVPVALFVPGPVHSDEKEWAGAEKQLDKELKNYPWFSPVARKIVGGKFDPVDLGFLFKLIPAMRKMPARDARDWVAIRAWASDLAVTLRPSLHLH
jgi:menaquinone-dependent protoporphyrinogen oxidase